MKLNLSFIRRSTHEQRLKENAQAIISDYDSRIRVLRHLHNDEVATLTQQVEAARREARTQFQAMVEANREAVIDTYTEVVEFARAVRPDGRPHCAGCAGSASEHGARCVATKIARYARNRAEELATAPSPKEDPAATLQGSGVVPPADPVTPEERDAITNALT